MTKFKRACSVHKVVKEYKNVTYTSKNNTRSLHSAHFLLHSIFLSSLIRSWYLSAFFLGGALSFSAMSNKTNQTRTKKKFCKVRLLTWKHSSITAEKHGVEWCEWASNKRWRLKFKKNSRRSKALRFKLGFNEIQSLICT